MRCPSNADPQHNQSMGRPCPGSCSLHAKTPSSRIRFIPRAGAAPSTWASGKGPAPGFRGCALNIPTIALATASPRFRATTWIIFYTWAEREDDLRVFCPKRYEDSKELPRLIAALDQRNVYPTRHHNHFAVKRVTPEGHYSIWFRVSRVRNFLLLVVESAYVRLDMDEQIARSAATKLIDVLVNTK